jgi:tripartite-type tricarboxylate transporter receptor subunit TctC
LPLHPRRDLKARRRRQRYSCRRTLQSNNVPAEIVAKLNQEVNSGLADAEMRARFINRGGYIASASSPADFGKLIGDYTEKWGKIIRAANIRLD